MSEHELFKRGLWKRVVPEGDDRPRWTCSDCGYIAYENPKIVVGSVCSWESRILLCRRAIPPCTGCWTLPAGYLERNETTEQGAQREAWEEARARLEIDTLLAVYNVPQINQVQIIYRARLLSPVIEPGPESREVALFYWSELPWDTIAFPTVRWALRQHHHVRDQQIFPIGGNPPEDSQF